MRVNTRNIEVDGDHVYYNNINHHDNDCNDSIDGDAVLIKMIMVTIVIIMMMI